MKNGFFSLCLSLTLAAPAFAGDDHAAHAGDIMVHESWARASIGSAPNSAAYMQLMTHGDQADKLIAVETPAAERAELHDHILDGDVARMQKIEAIDVKPGEPITLEPGGLHVMLMGVKDKLNEGDVLPLTLTFEKAGEVTLEVPIKGLKAGAGHGHGEGHEHGS